DPGLDRFAGMPGGNHPGGHVSGHDRAGADHGALTDGHSGMHEGLRADPGAIADPDRRGDELHVLGGVVVGARAEMGSLGDDRPGSQRYDILVVEGRTIADEDLVRADQIPGGPDVDACMDVAAGPQARTETSQDEGAPRMEGTR